MATIYKVTITTVSPFCNYPEAEVEQMFEDFLKTYRHPVTELGFESTIVIAQKDPAEVVNKDPFNEELIGKPSLFFMCLLYAFLFTGIFYLMLGIRLMLNGNY